MYSVDNRPIAVFDSGLGSISVIKLLMNSLRKENIIYLADRKHHPYGLKDQRVLKDIISNTIDYLLNYDPKLIIVGSITPSMTVLDQIRVDLEIPLFGIYLPIEDAVKLSSDITILGTRTLLKSNRLDELLKSHIVRADFRKVNASNIIRKVEEGAFDEIDKLIKDLELSNLTILSSTHLSLIKDRFEEIHRDVRFIDGIDNTIEQVRSYLTYHDMLADNQGLVKALVSKDVESFKIIADRFIKGLDVEEVSLSF
jgi:glutamate racemase